MGPGTHGEADVCGGQRGRVVDTVSGHGHDVTLLTETLDNLSFPMRLHFGFDLVDAKLFGNFHRELATISGDDGDAHALRTQFANGIRSRLLHAIGQREGPCELSVYGHKHEACRYASP